MQQQRPILQVALDFVDLARALQLADEAVAGGADWLEAGTPLIKSVGLDAVRRLKERFPQLTIVADLKIMDAGRIEVEYAAKAGAGVVTVLGAASDATIAECVESAREYGVKVAGDLINIADPLTRARELQALGVDYIDVHTPIDVQMQGRFPFEHLQAIAGAVDTPLCVAGGITSETAAMAVAHGARVVIVGGAITKAVDAVAATRAIRAALDTGIAVATTLYRRATQDTIREILLQVSASNVSDAMRRGGRGPGHSPIGAGHEVRGAGGNGAHRPRRLGQAGAGDRPGRPWRRAGDRCRRRRAGDLG